MFFRYVIIIALSICAILTSGCKQKTQLHLIISDNIDVRKEVFRFSEMYSLKVKAIRQKGTKVKVQFSRILQADEFDYVAQFLDKAIDVETRHTSQGMKIIIEEQNQATLTALELTNGQEFPIKLNIHKGEINLRERKEPYREVYCSYDIPVDQELPSLYYTTSLEIDSKDERIANLAKSIGNLQFTADHRIEFNDKPLNEISYRIGIIENKYISFMFDTTEASGVYTQYCPPSDFTECAATIISKCPDSFFGSLMFPKLSQTLQLYEFKTALF